MDIKQFFATTLLSTCLIACGGSSGGSSSEDGVFSGNTSEASLTADNQQDLAEATALGSAQAVSGDSLPTAALAAAGNSETLLRLTEKTIMMNTLPVAAEDVSQGVCTQGGSATVNSGQTTTVITYNQCDTGFGVFSGKATLTSASDGSFSISYRNFTITVDGETETLNATVSCDAQANCSIVSDFTAANGKTYRVENSVVSGNSSSGYSIQARVYEPQHGYVNFSATNVTFNCSNGYPGAGSLSFVSASQTVTVSFDSCNGYTLTIDGVATSYTW